MGSDPSPPPAKTPGVRRPHGFETLRVEGELPQGLRGTLYRAGPGLFERGGVVVEHPFEADGAIVGVRLDGSGTAEGAVRYVESDGFRQEAAAGKWLTGTAVPRWKRIVNALRGTTKNSGNTSLMQWQSRLFALMEAGSPVEMDPETLATVGDTDLGVVPRAFSAHPHRHPSRPLQLNFGVKFGPKTVLELFELPDQGQARQFGVAPAPWAAMIHDFALTDRYMVFFVGPSRLRMAKALMGSGELRDLFTWEPELGARIVVVPLDDPGTPRTFEVDPWWVWHVVNGWETEGGIVADVIEFPDGASLQAIADPNTPIGQPQYVRHTIDLRAGTTRREKLWDVPAEFPSIAESGRGRPHGRCYLQTSPDGHERAPSRRGVGWFDPGAGKGAQHVWDPAWDVSEPLLLSHPGGACLATMVDPRGEGTSHLALLDPDRLDDGPFARVHFDQKLPSGFHGTWRPDPGAG